MAPRGSSVPPSSLGVLHLLQASRKWKLQSGQAGREGRGRSDQTSVDELHLLQVRTVVRHKNNVAGRYCGAAKGTAAGQAGPAALRSAGWTQKSECCAELLPRAMSGCKLAAVLPSRRHSQREPVRHQLPADPEHNRTSDRCTHLTFPQLPHFQSPGLAICPGCRPGSITSPPGPSAAACSGLGCLHWLQASRHWKLRLAQEGHSQSPAGGRRLAGGAMPSRRHSEMAGG